ncbi:hypothetical protein FRC17_003673 [Serendipita sp. 399]|nr:hypothetical protein FRC17_003673 [Serendipita sp. 399]
MSNLRSLDVQGYLSKDRMANWYSTLLDLSTTRLQRLRLMFSYDNLEMRPIDPGQFLGAPHMQSLEVLCIPSEYLISTKQHVDDFFSSSRMLPNLTTIYDDGNPLLLNIYLHRKVRRVLLEFPEFGGASPFANLRSSKTKLTHLSTEYPHRELLKLVSDNLDLFTRLRHIGILNFQYHLTANITSDLALLSTLPNLSSIELDTSQGETSYLSDLRVQLPMVIRVFHNKTIWRFYDGQWNAVSGQYTSWEIVNMGLDPSLDTL